MKNIFYLIYLSIAIVALMIFYMPFAVCRGIREEIQFQRDREQTRKLIWRLY